MLSLDLPAEPCRLDLPRGIRVEIRPATTAVMAAAQAAPARRRAVIRLGGPDLDPGVARGLSSAFVGKALARHAVTAWEGVGDRDGQPRLVVVRPSASPARSREHLTPAMTAALRVVINLDDDAGPRLPAPGRTSMITARAGRRAPSRRLRVGGKARPWRAPRHRSASRTPRPFGCSGR